METKIKELIANDVNKALAHHRGTCHFVKLEDKVVHVELGGMCKGCPGRKMTILNIVKPYLMDNVEGLKDVVLG